MGGMAFFGSSWRKLLLSITAMFRSIPRSISASQKMKRFTQDPALLAEYAVEVLPLLSVKNVRELRRAAMPLPQLSPQEAAQLVSAHFVNRMRSRKSRLKRR